MSIGGRVARLTATVLLTLGVAGTAPDRASAANDSPERAVEAFWDHIQFGKPEAAVNQFRPMCRKKVRPAISKMSRDLTKLLKPTPLLVEVAGYDEKVRGRNARVSYRLRLINVDNEYDHAQIGQFNGQKWVRSGPKWLLDCTARLGRLAAH